MEMQLWSAVLYFAWIIWSLASMGGVFYTILELCCANHEELSFWEINPKFSNAWIILHVAALIIWLAALFVINFFEPVKI